jgi:hypothetical protein
VPATLAVKKTVGGPVRLRHSAEAPICAKCGTNEHVIRLWHGGHKAWVCDIHYRVTSTKKQEATMIQRVLHRLPEPETFSVSEILPNRAARRRRK